MENSIFKASTLVSLVLLSSISFSLSAKLCHPQDEKALFQIKNQWGNPSSLSMWNFQKDCCKDWGDNVNCNKQGRVTYIYIVSAEDAKGKFPSAFGDLPFLETILIYNIPHVFGPIPPAIAKLSKLDTFLIYGPSKLYGPIPDFFGRFENLTAVVLAAHNLTGPIPSSLGQLTKLKTLNLRGNKLSGTIPDIFVKMTSLTYVELSDNYFSGPIPGSIGHTDNPCEVNIPKNRLTGPIPKSLGRANINRLDLSFNKIYGDASFLFGKENSAITYLDLRYNVLSFDFSNVDLNRAIKGFNVSHNMIYGALPKHLGQLPLEFIDVSYNQLCGPIPTGRRLNQFSPIFFRHNKCLCGRPLPPCK